jgi:mono/diheme cytochrome c family protein
VRGILLAVLLLLAGCDEMASQPREKPSRPTGLAPADGAVPANARAPAVPRLSEALLQRGRERYDIACAACHGLAGDGDGMVVRRGFPAPVSFHDPRLRTIDPAHVVEVIEHGFGVMYPHADRVAPDDRWAIAAYLKALQASQDVHVQELPR